MIFFIEFLQSSHFLKINIQKNAIPLVLNRTRSWTGGFFDYDKFTTIRDQENSTNRKIENLTLNIPWITVRLCWQ